MLAITLLTIFSVLLVTVIMALATSLGEKSLKEREKMTPFECGFSPFKKARSPFSLRFFMVTLIFLIFDIEIALLLPLGLMLNIESLLLTTKLAFIVILILLGGLLHEWKQGALNWVK